MKSLLPVLFLLYGSCCISQENNFHFRFINLPENFRNQYITLVDEDDAGMLWFVTNNGLHRYDGNEVLTFDIQSVPALPDINIRYLFAGSHRNLWLATQNKLLRFDLQQWTIATIPFPENIESTTREHSVSVIAEGADSTLYVGLADGKLCRIVNGRLQLIVQLRAPPAEAAQASLSITAIDEPARNELWLTTDKGQLIHIHHDKEFAQPEYFEPAAVAGQSLTFLQFSHAGTCLVQAANKAFYLFEPATASFKEINLPLDAPSIKNSIVYASALENDKAAFFFAGYNAAQKGFGEYDFKTARFTNLSTVYPASFKNSIFRKVRYRKGRTFISTDRGIACVSYVNNPFRVSLSGLENINSIRTIYKQPGNGLYIGSYQEKFMLVNEETGSKKSLSPAMISCLLPWSADTLLAGSEGWFPQWYLPKKNLFIPALNGESIIGNHINNYVVCLRRENDSLVWAGSYKGCYLFNARTGKILNGEWSNDSNRLSQLNTAAIITLGNSRYFATAEGVFSYNVSNGVMRKLFTTPGSAYASANTTCLQLADGLLWAGTIGNGILVFDSTGSIVKKLTIADGLASNVVFSIVACNDYVLAGTGNGLSVITKSSGAIRNYSSLYYLPSNEFNRSAWFVNADTVYMGTINGLVRFNPRQLLQQTGEHIPAIYLSGLTISNGSRMIHDYAVPYRQNPLLTVPSGSKYFSIALGGINDADAELNLFYRLSSNAAWQSIGQRREITFVGMMPGSYTISVAARLPDGKWIENILNVPLKVEPSFYQTWWFKLLLAAAGLSIIWLAVRYRERNLLKEQQLRSRIASDLHDEVGSALTRIYFQADMLSGASAGDADSHLPALQKIAAGSQEALSSMSDMVWSIDAHYDNATEMVARMKDYIARMHEELDCRCVFEVSGNYEKKHLTQVSRQNIFLIFKEAINNALKYGNGGLNVKLAFGEYFIMIIENKINTQSATSLSQGGHGLQGMQLRAEKIKGTITIQKSENDFSVTLKVKG